MLLAASKADARMSLEDGTMIDLSAADAVIIVGVLQGLIGLGAPDKILAWQRLSGASLVTTGFWVAFVGLALKVVLG